MTYIKTIFLAIIACIYLIHGSFSLGLAFFGHHQINSNNTSVELTCWPESENCCSSTNSCIQFCVSEEYQIYSKTSLAFHEHNGHCDNDIYKYLSILSYNLENLYIIPHIKPFSERNLFVFDEIDLIWIIKLTT